MLGSTDAGHYSGAALLSQVRVQNRRQVAGTRQAAGGRRQEAGGRRQAAGDSKAGRDRRLSASRSDLISTVDSAR